MKERASERERESACERERESERERERERERETPGKGEGSLLNPLGTRATSLCEVMERQDRDTSGQ